MQPYAKCKTKDSFLMSISSRLVIKNNSKNSVFKCCTHSRETGKEARQCRTGIILTSMLREAGLGLGNGDVLTALFS